MPPTLEDLFEQHQESCLKRNCSQHNNADDCSESCGCDAECTALVKEQFNNLPEHE